MIKWVCKSCKERQWYDWEVEGLSDGEFDWELECDNCGSVHGAKLFVDNEDSFATLTKVKLVDI